VISTKNALDEIEEGRRIGLKEDLKVGEVSNMYAIIEAISKGQKVMMP